MDDLQKRMVVGQIMQSEYDRNPPNLSELSRELRGCAELYRIAADHLEADPPRFHEAVRAIQPALSTGVSIHDQAVMGYVFSGEATDDLMETMRKGLGD